MVARRREGEGQAGEDAARIVGHRGDLAVHRRRRPVDAPAEVAADRLVAEADAEQRPPCRGAGGDQVERDAGRSGVPGR